jgi:hypothetical protein
MAVHVDEIVSNVTAEAAPQTEPAGQTVEWREMERMCEAHARMMRDRLRTEAEGYDD